MGVQYIRSDKCSNCMKCWRNCPMDVFSTAGKQVYIAYPEDCMSCYLCELECPDDAIYVEAKRSQIKPLPW